MAEQTSTTHEPAVAESLRAVAEARQKELLTTEAERNIGRWLTDPVYEEYRKELIEIIREGKFKELNDAFWTVIPFGTGGRRGRMYPVGTNTMNDRTVGESAQGLADYLRKVHGPDAKLSCVIAYDTRYNSDRFARLTASVLAGNGIQALIFDDPRSTPQLSFTVRHRKASAGVVISASHNPPSDNGFKCFWSTGGQVLPPHDEGIIECVKAVREIKRIEFGQGLREGIIRWLGPEADEPYVQAVAAISLSDKRDLRVVYSPLHGVGQSNIEAVLRHCGFTVELVDYQALHYPDFFWVPNRTPNPEWPPAMLAATNQAKDTGADLAIASDPDADRIGAAAYDPLTGKWRYITGNQIGALLTDYVVRRRKERGDLPEGAFVVKTLVTTDLIAKIAESAGVRVVGDLPVGFKWIGQAIDQYGPDKFVFAAEESHGYLCGTYARDKDGAAGALLLAELTAELKAAGSGLWQRLRELYRQHGYFVEQTKPRLMPGESGAKQIQALMERLRTDPPRELAGLRVLWLHDYKPLESRPVAASGEPRPLSGMSCDQVVLELDRPGWRVVGRPSGTEPKIKFYYLGYEPPQRCGTDAELQRVAEEAEQLVNRLAEDVERFVAETVGTQPEQG